MSLPPSHPVALRWRAAPMALFSLSALLVAGCMQAGAGAGSDAGTDGGVCDGKESCDSCLTCARANPCAAELNACENDSSCVGIELCFTECGTDLECREQCYLANPLGVDLYEAALDCLYCVECRRDCAGVVPCT